MNQDPVDQFDQHRCSKIFEITILPDKAYETTGRVCRFLLLFFLGLELSDLIIQSGFFSFILTRKHLVTLIRQLAQGIVFVDFAEQFFQLFNSFFTLRQPLL